MKIDVRLLYIYIFLTLGLLMSTAGAVMIINLGLKKYIFTQADYQYLYYDKIDLQGNTLSEDDIQTRKRMATEERGEQVEAERQNTMAMAVALMAVGTPIFGYHRKLSNGKG